MKKNPLFEKCLANVDPDVREEVRLNMDIANKIYEMLQSKHMTQRELATRLGKRESEVSRWLTGSHGFTTATLAKISTVLGEPIVEIKREPEANFVFVPIDNFVSFSETIDESFTNKTEAYFKLAYAN